ncbi:MAG: uroporphyrinogen decarboxylase [Lachnospiraceae bacterium]|nr:uroporphyrinogen decarboxylase [Lachnospiraceae bacterium]
MTKKERIMAAIRGEKPDKLPYSFWSHMPGTDLDPEAIAEKTYEFYKTYDFDFIKTMNNGMYAIEDFGCTVDYSEIEKGGVAKLVNSPIRGGADLAKLSACSLDEGSYARELRHLELVLKKVEGEEVPVIFTVFAPITTAEKLCGGRLLSFVKEGFGEQVKHALTVITETTCELAKRAIGLGVDGIFLASQTATYDKCTAAEYLEYGKPYDLQVLEAAKGGWMNTLHCHGDNIMFEILKDYPVQIFNWHAWETFPELDEAYALSGKCLMGGLKRTDITKRDKGAIQNQIFQCFKQLGGRHHILTPGCVIRYPLDEEMLAFIGQTRNEIEKVFDGKERRA